MSEISEKKALEAYPVIPSPYYGGDEDRNLKYRFGFIKGYDQAMQDFLEKAEEFFNEELYVSVSDQICSMNEFKTKKDFVNYFKNYIQNESEE